MKKAVFIIGLALFLTGFTYSQEQKASSKKVAEGDTYTPFGKYTIELLNELLIVDGEQATSYRIAYENSPLSVTVVVDKDKKCKNYIVVSEKVSVMYKCNGEYFGINKIEEKYIKDGFITDTRNLDNFNFFHQKYIVAGQQEEVNATMLIAAFYPYLLK